MKMTFIKKSNSNKKAQSSLEFLMTYGWALLLILVALVVAWQMGLFQPKNTEAGSSGFWGIVINDFSYNTGGTLKLSIRNEVGAQVTITKINVTINGKSTSDTTPLIISAGERRFWSNIVSGGGGSLGSHFEAIVKIDYQDIRIGDTYRSTGKIWGPIEAV